MNCRKKLKLIVITLIMLLVLVLGSINVYASTEELSGKIFYDWDGNTKPMTSSVTLPDGVTVNPASTYTHFDLYVPEIEEYGQTIPDDYELGAGINVSVNLVGASSDNIEVTYTVPLPEGYNSVKVTTFDNVEIPSRIENGKVIFNTNLKHEYEDNYVTYGWMYFKKVEEQIVEQPPVEEKGDETPAEELPEEPTSETPTEEAPTEEPNTSKFKLDNEPKTGKDSLVFGIATIIISSAVAIIIKKKM